MTRALAEGTILRERYEIVELVGRGGMGATYRARDLRLEGRFCAVKEALPDPDAGPEELRQSRQQFYHEASTLARLDHPNLPKVSDYFSSDDRDYLVMDFVAGLNLHEMLSSSLRQGHPLPERQVLTWADQLCDALNYLHTQDPPVLHRDIKPSNIKISPAGTVKLVDFGLVKLLSSDEERTITVVQGRGSVQYTPLEQYGSDAGHTDARSDIYSLGATLYHLLTGQPPLDAKNRFLKPGSMPAPRTLNAPISPQTERAIVWALSMHPDERPPSVAAFRSELLAPGVISRTFARVFEGERAFVPFLVAHRGLLALLGALVLVAALITARPAPISSAPTPTLEPVPTVATPGSGAPLTEQSTAEAGSETSPPARYPRNTVTAVPTGTVPVPQSR